MVGLKTFWITLSTLMLLASCVPQAKKSTCGSNEAFNTTLRTCVPVIQGPSAFIDITSYTPTIPYTKYKNVTGPGAIMPFTINISNPYLQPYFVRWKHNYNGIETVTKCLPSTTTGSNVETLNVLLYKSKIGINILIADIVDSCGSANAHDSQIFQFIISDTPKPSITDSDPDDYDQEVSPIVSPYPNFVLTTANNSSASLSSYAIEWRLSGSSIGTVLLQTDPFFITTPTGSNVSTLSFDPTPYSIGRYYLRARIILSGVTVIDERTWNVVIKHPSFGVISSASLPSPSVITNTYHDVSYQDFAYSFADSSYTKANYCVRVSDPDGAYVNGSAFDPTSKNVLVRFYKSASDLPSAYLYEGKTTPADDTVCFSDATAVEQDLLIFNDGDPTVTYPKELIARVYDEQTLTEMCISDACTSVTYPVRWNLNVKPKNKGPVAVINPFIAGDNITYTSSGTSSRNATVVQDQAFTVRFNLKDEDLPIGWNPAVNTNKFSFVGELKQGATVRDATSCVKATGTATAGPNYSCTFTIPSFDAYGTSGVNPPAAYTLVLSAQDVDSQVPTSTAGISNVLTWNLTATESQTRPTIALNAVLDSGAVTVDEKDTLTFVFNISDAQRDSYTLRVARCSNAACTSETNFSNNSTTQSYPSIPVGLYNTNNAITYTLREDEVGSLASGPLYFRAHLSDIPSNPLLGLPARDGTAPLPYMDFTVTVNNVNNIPVINNARLTSPLIGNVTAYDVYAGNTFSLSTIGGAVPPFLPAVTDSSDITTSPSESTLNYQWFIRQSAGPGAWQAIDGATSSTLRWTPGPELSGNHDLSFCVADGFPRIAATHASGVCTSVNYLVNVKSNLAKLTTVTGATGDVAIHHVPGNRLAYVAYVTTDGGGKNIHVEKVTYKLNGTLNSSGMRMAKFRAISATTIANTVKDLSITASDDYVYVAYLADELGGAPGSISPRVRKINIDTDPAEGTKTNPVYADSVRRFDFTYEAVTATATCTGGTNCLFAAGPRTITFDGTAMNTVADFIDVTVPPYSAVRFLSSTTAPTPNGFICANCSANDQAITFANAVNFYATTNNLQGLTAAASASVVTFHGVEFASSYNSPDVATAMGKILYQPTLARWYVPVINSSLAAPNQNKVQILSATDGSISGVEVANTLTTLDSATVVDNSFGPAPAYNMVLGYISSSGSVTKVINLITSGNLYVVPPATTPLTIFPAQAATQLKIKASLGSSNPNIFVLIKDTANDWRLARLPENLSTSGVQERAEDIGALTADYTILNGDIADMDIQPALPLSPATSSNEARVVVISNSSGLTYKTHLFRWSQTSGPTESLASSGAESLELSTQEASATSKIATATPAFVQMGVDGSTIGESTNAMMGIVRFNNDGRVDAQFINSEVESIQSIMRSTSGFFHPPYVK